jgi:hypothetical protein
MKEEKGRELTKRELHMDFGGSIVGRCYRVFETKNSNYEHKDYIYENDQDLAERFKRFEELERLDKDRKKKQLEQKLKNEGLEVVLNDIFEE